MVEFSDRLTEFLVKAKRKTYAGNMEPRRLKDESKKLVHKRGVWSYEDVYNGSNPFNGLEQVFFKDTKVWKMAYQGRVLKGDSKEIYDALKVALSKVDANAPFRGFIGEPLTGSTVIPCQSFTDLGDKIYSCWVTGDIQYFHGGEAIFQDQETIYEGQFHGMIL